MENEREKNIKEARAYFQGRIQVMKKIIRATYREIGHYIEILSDDDLLLFMHKEQGWPREENQPKIITIEVGNIKLGLEAYMMPNLTCDYPNCTNQMNMNIYGNRDVNPYSSQWCAEHYEYVRMQLKKDPDWIVKFQNGMIRNLPKRFKVPTR